VTIYRTDRSGAIRIVVDTATIQPTLLP